MCRALCVVCRSAVRFISGEGSGSAALGTAAAKSHHTLSALRLCFALCFRRHRPLCHARLHNTLRTDTTASNFAIGSSMLTTMTAGTNTQRLRLRLLCGLALTMALLCCSLVEAVAPVGDVPLGCILPLTGENAADGLRAKVRTRSTRNSRDAGRTETQEEKTNETKPAERQRFMRNSAGASFELETISWSSRSFLRDSCISLLCLPCDFVLPFALFLHRPLWNCWCKMLTLA